MCNMLAIKRRCISLFSALIIINYLAVHCEDDIRQLPHCIESNDQQVAVIVGTLDGKISALNSIGGKLWEVETGPGPLLISNIHKLELTNNGQWIRIIPSLSGSLYKFDGKTIDAIPINADSLLKSSFLYSDDLIIAGGREVRTYGVAINSGKLVYECSLSGCQNKTEHETEVDDVIVVERSTLTIRAHEPRSGEERWNFSVGLHDIKIPQISCINLSKDFNFDLTAIVPEGSLMAIKDNNILWQHKFKAPIVSVWKWNGRQMATLDLFCNSKPTEADVISPAIYVGMHNKQLYVHESVKMLNALQIHHTIKTVATESKSVATIPWKPISATQLAIIPAENDDTTALSVLYSSEYVNGNGFYLYMEKDDNLLCDNNTDQSFSNANMNVQQDSIFSIFWFTWKQFLLLFMPTIIAWTFVRQRFFERHQRLKLSEQIKERSTSSISTEQIRTKNISESSDVAFSSRYTTDFETVRCLGKGGFGIVFEVRQKIDECGYAIKRIPLPNEDVSKGRVMREVRTLAKLDHHNIVRYYNSWLEKPPVGWNRDHDQKYISDPNITLTSETTTLSSPSCTHKRNSTVIDIDKDSFLDDPIKILDSERVQIHSSDDDSHGIYFEKGSDESDDKQTYVETSESTSETCLSSTLPEEETVTPVYLYIQMQLCRKESLKEWLLENSNREYKHVLIIFSQILNAVEYIHNNGLIHRDLKPSNIFFSMEGNVKVGDFGLVTGMQESIENEGNVNSSINQSHTRGVGTQLYMSPEQRDGKNYNYKVDIWSLGIIFFELLVPFSTEMEKTQTLSTIRSNIYPPSFSETHALEYELLQDVLSHEPDKRPTVAHIKSSPIFQNNDIPSF